MQVLKSAKGKFSKVHKAS